jgi:hypothetical protein
MDQTIRCTFRTQEKRFYEPVESPVRRPRRTGGPNPGCPPVGRRRSDSGGLQGYV